MAVRQNGERKALRWLLDLAQTPRAEIASLPEGRLRDAYLRAWQFCGSAKITGSEPDAERTQLDQVATELGVMLRCWQRGEPYKVPLDRVTLWLSPKSKQCPVQYIGEFSTVFMCEAASLIAAERHWLRQCRWEKCGRWFAANMRGEYCSKRHSNLARRARFEAAHPTRRHEYYEAKMKRETGMKNPSIKAKRRNARAKAKPKGRAEPPPPKRHPLVWIRSVKAVRTTYQCAQRGAWRTKRCGRAQGAR
jgi:hypothetical protein